MHSGNPGNLINELMEVSWHSLLAVSVIQRYLLNQKNFKDKQRQKTDTDFGPDPNTKENFSTKLIRKGLRFW